MEKRTSIRGKCFNKLIQIHTDLNKNENFFGIVFDISDAGISFYTNENAFSKQGFHVLLLMLESDGVWEEHYVELIREEEDSNETFHAGRFITRNEFENKRISL